MNLFVFQTFVVLYLLVFIWRAVRMFKALSFDFYLFLIVFFIQTDKLQTNRDTVYFRDGVRRIDFVLSYVDDKDERKQVSITKETAFLTKMQCEFLPLNDFYWKLPKKLKAGCEGFIAQLLNLNQLLKAENSQNV